MVRKLTRRQPLNQGVPKHYILVGKRWQLTVPGALCHVQWFRRGPLESYMNRESN